MKYKLRNLKDYKFLKGFKNFERNKNQINIDYQNGKVQIRFLNEKIFRVRLTNKNFEEDYSYVIVKKDWEDVEFTISEEEDQIIILTSKLQIRINKRIFILAIYDSEGSLILQDAGFGGYAWHDKEVISFKKMPSDEHYYGFGEKAGKFDKRDYDLINWNIDALMYNHKTDPLYLSIPFFIGLRDEKAYGIFLDNTYKSFFNMGKKLEGIYYFGAVEGELNYYFIFGPEIKEIINFYTQLTGRPYLPPKWALGYQQSKWSYKNELQVRKVANELRKRRIPCDTIVLDIDFMDGFRIFTWNRKRFPNPNKLISDMAELGFKMYVIVDPGIKVDTTYSIYNEGMEEDYFCKQIDGSLFHGWVWPGKCVFPDFTKTSVRDWWGKNLIVYLNEGIAGIWNDMNEPSVESGNIIDSIFRKVSTMDLLHYDNGLNSNHSKIHNIYGLFMAMATWDGLLKLQPNKRPFMISRSGFAGIQRYAAIWTGDNTSSWRHLKLSLTMLLNMGLSGIHFCGADIGGFAPSLMHPRKFFFKIDPTLYARWIQLGVFYPLCRTHTISGSHPQEPWQFGKKIEKISRRYIELRYSLLPYIYTLFYEASISGIPIMRPLILEYQDDKKCLQLDSEFLFGNNFLVVPITKKRIKRQKIYLPKGKWINYWTKIEYEGPKEMELRVSIKNIPVFVKGGSIIPMQPIMQYVNEKSLNPLILDIYPHEQSEFQLYEDDGDSFDSQKGDFCTTKYRCAVEQDKISFNIEKREGEFQPEEREYELRFNCLKNMPQKIIFNGKELSLEKDIVKNSKDIPCSLIYDEIHRILYIKFPVQNIETDIELVF